MTQKTFTMREIAQIKRTAQNVAPMVTKREKLLSKISALQLEVATLDKQIDAWEIAVKAMTNGFTSSDLINRVVKESVSEDGKVTKTVTYELKFPETVIPVLEEAEVLIDPLFPTIEGCNATPTMTGTDFDIDVQ